jgi:hypothetical protein
MRRGRSPTVKEGSDFATLYLTHGPSLNGRATAPSCIEWRLVHSKQKGHPMWAAFFLCRTNSSASVYPGLASKRFR